jgi:putative adenylate-forming enzyme
MMDRLWILYHYLQTRYHARRRNRAAIRAWQAAQMARQVAWVLEHSPFYRAWWGGTDTWAEAPIITKQVMMAHFDTLNTVGVAKEEALAVALRAERERNFMPTVRGVTVGLSSGTSGTRGLFLVSPQERLAWAGSILAKLLPAPLWVPQKVAFFLRANSNLYQTVASRTLQFRYFDLLEPMAGHIKALNEWQPTVLAAPPSLLRLLAEAQASGQLHIAPRKVIGVAEVLDPIDEQVIAEQFGAPIHQVYQATEGLIATTCHLGTLHLSEDVMVVQREPLSDEGKRFVPILSDFRRRTQPILRYRLDDVLVLRDAPCPCGSAFTALERIEGRCDDLFYLRKLSGDDGWIPLFPDYVRRVIINHAPTLRAYIARQSEAERVEIALEVPEGDYPTAQITIEAGWQALCAKVGAIAPRLYFTQEIPPRPPERKLKRVERVWSPYD